MTQIISSHTMKTVAAGTLVRFRVPDESSHPAGTVFEWTVAGPGTHDIATYPGGAFFDLDTTGKVPGSYDVNARLAPEGTGAGPAAEAHDAADMTTLPKVMSVVPHSNAGQQAHDGPYEPWTLFIVGSSSRVPESGVMPVSLQRTSMIPTSDQVLWVMIRNRTQAIGFRRYREFVDQVMGSGTLDGIHEAQNYRGPQAYDLLRRATDAFLMQETGIVATAPFTDLTVPGQRTGAFSASGGFAGERGRLGRDVSVAELERLRNEYYQRLGEDQPGMLPYFRIIRERLADIPLKSPDDVPPNAYGILPSALAGPAAIELIWSYWHEEGMLAQTLNAVLARFQNRRAPGRDPLARFDLDPLRPLSNIFWGWVQDEMKRLTVRRRSYEYEHEYGLRLLGKAVPTEPAADRRSKFLEALHNLLFLNHVFFKEDDDTTVLADGFPVLNALRETHLVLAEGAHNQYGDLPTTARAEMLTMQWLLARPEMRDFLGGRVMVPYEEPWMDRVDSMKQMQGWGDTSITHFRDMGVYGEQILLSIRFGNWSVVNDPQQAANWARYWRPEIQRYTHAYRSATGIDLTERVDSTSPSFLLARRLGTARSGQS